MIAPNIKQKTHGKVEITWHRSLFFPGLSHLSLILFPSPSPPPGRSSLLVALPLCVKKTQMALPTISGDSIVLVICYSILALKMFFAAFYTGYARKRNSFPTAPEDAKFYKSTVSQLTNAEAVPEQVLRAQRIHMNDLENNIPFIFAVIVMYYAYCNETAITVLVALFTAARVAYTVAYLFSLQPFRSIFYSLGSFLTMGMVAYGFVNMFFHLSKPKAGAF